VSPALKFNCPLSQIDQNFHSDEPKPLTRRPVVIGLRKSWIGIGSSGRSAATFSQHQPNLQYPLQSSANSLSCAHGFDTQVDHVDRLILGC
jgi:hypothetical protein